MVMRLTVGLAGDQQLDRSLARAMANLDDWSPALDKIADMLADENREQFTTEGRHGSGHAWAPLSPKYRKWKMKHFPGRPILVRTGKLRKAMTVRPFAVEYIGRNAMRLSPGADIPYAEYHQTGTRRMPRRRPLALSSTARRAMTKVLQRYALTGEV